MKKFIFLLLLFISTILIAHPVSDLTLAFDTETSLLTVQYIHKVSNAEKHYIKEVTVYLNGEPIISQQLGKQEDNQGGSLVFKIIGTKQGDIIKVQTKCNKFGKKSQELEL